jgi:hypothetical protein
MKIEATVLSAADNGDRLTITAQGWAKGSAEWRPICRVELAVPMTDRNRKAYFVGRRFDIDLTPR